MSLHVANKPRRHLIVGLETAKGFELLLRAKACLENQIAKQISRFKRQKTARFEAFPLYQTGSIPIVEIFFGLRSLTLPGEGKELTGLFKQLHRDKIEKSAANKEIMWFQSTIGASVWWATRDNASNRSEQPMRY